MAGTADLGSDSLIPDLERLLSHLQRNPYPFVPNPPGCKKRASVACIIRVRPTYPDVPDFIQLPPNTPVEDRLKAFFEQPWVRRGEPELALIKRATRQGDRWNGHIALPGGKRDPEDESDLATSIRETSEEIGLDLTADYAIHTGNLPERVVTTESGLKPVMVLCPYLFLLTKFDIPSLVLQPTEVGSTHWVPIRALLSPSLRTYERADVVDRLHSNAGLLSRGITRFLFGQLLYDATRLMPTESIWCRLPLDFPSKVVKPAFKTRIRHELSEFLLGDHAYSDNSERPLLLWGLTHGMIADFLDLFPGREASKSWKWPTLSSPDMTFFIWLVSYRYRASRMRTLPFRGEEHANAPSFMNGDGLVTKSTHEVTTAHRMNQARIDGMGITEQNTRLTPHSAVGHMLNGYSSLLWKGALLAILVRVGLTAVAMRLLFRKKSWQRSIPRS